MNGSNNLSVTSVVDGLINDFFGSSFDSIWESLENLKLINDSNVNTKNYYVSTKSTVDKDGNVVVETNDNGKKYTARYPGVYVPVNCNNKLPSSIVSGTEFPKLDAYLDEGNNLHIECDIPNVEMDDFAISTEGQNLIIEIRKPQPPKEKRAYLVTGRKIPEGRKVIAIDPLKWNIDKVDWKVAKGTIFITIPKSQFVAGNKVLKGFKK